MFRTPFCMENFVITHHEMVQFHVFTCKINMLSLCFNKDFSIYEQSTENRLRSQRTPTPYKIKLNNCKLIDFMIRIELTRAILMTRFSNFLKISINHIRMFLYLGTCFLRVTVLFLCRSQAVSDINGPIYP